MCSLDEGAVAADGQSLPPEGVEQEAAVVLPLAALPELGPGQGSTCHHLPDLAVPRHQRPVQEQPVSLSQDPALALPFFTVRRVDEGLFRLQPDDGGAGPDAAGAPGGGGALHPAFHEEHLEEQLPAGRSGGRAPLAGLLRLRP